MKTAEILSVGEELLSGNVVDTNAAYLSRALQAVGIQTLHRQTCGDEEAEIVSALECALSRSDLVLVTGGLGPTCDDLTRPCAARVFGKKMLFSEKIADHLRAYFQRRGVTMSENNLLQAYVPEDATVLWNDWGTAPGLMLESEKGCAILLPGVPREMKELFIHRVMPILKARSKAVTEQKILRFYGISESLLDHTLAPVAEKNPGVTIAPYAGNGEIALHVRATARDGASAEALCKKAEEEVRALVGDFCYGEEEDSLERCLVRICREKGITVSTAESCTGGLLSQRITSVPGASHVFSLGACTYSESQKQSLLGVSCDTLDRFGVYSRECALEMARGIRRLAGSHVGIGITGIAGPDGGGETDPVGTVYLAVSSERGETVERCVFGSGALERDFIRWLASSKALFMAHALIERLFA